MADVIAALISIHGLLTFLVGYINQMNLFTETYMKV